MTSADVRETNREVGPQVSRRVKIAAYVVPFLVLPSSLFRFKVAFTGPVCDPELSTGTYTAGFGENLYIIALSLLSMGAAFLTFGLVQRWGEVFPRWIPGVGGRQVLVLGAVIPAAFGVLFLGSTSLWQVAITVLDIENPSQDKSCVFPQSGPAEVALTLAYLPLLAWGPLLAIVTVAYYKRRRASR